MYPTTQDTKKYSSTTCTTATEWSCQLVVARVAPRYYPQNLEGNLGGGARIRPLQLPVAAFYSMKRQLIFTFHTFWCNKKPEARGEFGRGARIRHYSCLQLHFTLLDHLLSQGSSAGAKRLRYTPKLLEFCHQNIFWAIMACARAYQLRTSSLPRLIYNLLPLQTLPSAVHCPHAAYILMIRYKMMSWQISGIFELGFRPL